MIVLLFTMILLALIVSIVSVIAAIVIGGWILLMLIGDVFVCVAIIVFAVKLVRWIKARL